MQICNASSKFRPQSTRKSDKRFCTADMSAQSKTPDTTRCEGGGPRVVVSTAAFHARVRGSVSGLGGLKETKKFFSIHV